jgi:hypothetical protein
MVSGRLLEVHTSIMVCFVQCRHLPVHHFREGLGEILGGVQLDWPSMGEIERRNEALERQIEELEREFARLLLEKGQVESRNEELLEDIRVLQEELIRMEGIVKSENKRLLFERTTSSNSLEPQPPRGLVFLSSLTHFERGQPGGEQSGRP